MMTLPPPRLPPNCATMDRHAHSTRARETSRAVSLAGSVAAALLLACVDLPRTPSSNPLDGGTLVADVQTSSVTATAVVDLTLSAEPGVVARISNLSDLPEDGSRTFALDPNTCADDGPSCVLTVEWDLDFGLAAPCPEQSECPRTVYAEFSEAETQRSLTDSASVLLDRRPPALTAATLTYRPRAGSAVSQATAAGPGATVTLVIDADEAVRSLPTFLTANGPGASNLTFLRLDQDGRRATFEATIPANGGGLADGFYALSFSLADGVGNEASFPSGATARVLISPPQLIVDQSRVSYVRSPVGRGQAEALGDFTVPAGPYYALAPFEPVSPTTQVDANAFSFADRGSPAGLRVWADDRQQSAVSSVIRPQIDQTWHRDDLRWSADSAEVYVTGIDDAGNESAPVRIDNVWYVVTSAGGGTIGVADRVLSPSDPLDPADEPAALDQPDNDAAVQASGFVWRLQSNTTPGARYHHAMAYDADRDRVVLFGGVAPTGERLMDTWELNNDTWTQIAPTDQPTARFGHAMAYDPNRRRVVLFGGDDDQSPAEAADTWEWDGVNWTLVSSTANPPGRRYHAMAYDAGRARMVLFAGSADSTKLGDIWERSGTEWTQAQPSSGPTNRDLHAMVFDPHAALTLVFGGSGGGFLNQLWGWDGDSWISLSSTSSVPPGRNALTMAYDEARRRSVIFGGHTGPDEYLSDLWTYDDGAWTSPPTDAFRPLGRRSSSMVYDSARQRFVLFGGQVANQPDASLADTWILRSVKPAVHFDVRLPEGIDTESLQDLRVRTHCGGRSLRSLPDTYESGAELLGWSSSAGWTVLATNTTPLPLSGPPAASLMDYRPPSSPAPTTQEYVFIEEPAPRMQFICRAVAINNHDYSQVALDYIEAWVRYQP